MQYRLYFIKCNTYIHPKKTRIFIDNLIYYNTWEIHCIFHMNIGILRTHVYCVWRDVYIVMYVIKVYAFFLNKKNFIIEFFPVLIKVNLYAWVSLMEIIFPQSKLLPQWLLRWLPLKSNKFAQGKSLYYLKNSELSDVTQWTEMWGKKV